MRSALMLVNAELDSMVNSGLPRLLTALLQGQKRYAVHLYPGTRHAFHSDTGASYDPEAACDAWQKTLAFFRRYLDAPRTQV
jgi:carboxymethylenebutenolidase